MFVSETHLPQLLRAEHYSSPAFLARELEDLFVPGWHLVGATSEFPRDGCFVTLELLGRPLIVWRVGDRYQTFLNVCPHRFSQVTCAPTGCTQQLKCQYHGWEFGTDGTTRKIPDAPSFRPLSGERIGLRPFRTQRVGQLVFATLNDDAPDLRTYLGPGYAMCEDIFGDEWMFSMSRNRPIECNWKLFMENSIESYHIPIVHPETFRHWPAENEMTHQFDPRWSRLHTTGRGDKLAFLDAFAHRLIGLEQRSDYESLLCYPNLLIGRASMYSWIDSLVPDGPDRVLVRARSFQRVGARPTLRRRFFAGLVRRFTERFIGKLLPEDEAILAILQKSYHCPELPGTGLISRREERIHHFQRYVAETMGVEPQCRTSDSSARPIVTNGEA